MEKESYKHVPEDVIYLIERIFTGMSTHDSLSSDQKELVKNALNDIQNHPEPPSTSCAITVSNDYQRLLVAYTDSTITISDTRVIDYGDGSDNETPVNFYYETGGYSEEDGDLSEFENDWEEILEGLDPTINVSEEY